MPFKREIYKNLEKNVVNHWATGRITGKIGTTRLTMALLQEKQAPNIPNARKQNGMPTRPKLIKSTIA